MVNLLGFRQIVRCVSPARMCHLALFSPKEAEFLRCDMGGGIEASRNCSPRGTWTHTMVNAERLMRDTYCEPTLAIDMIFSDNVPESPGPRL
jgi:hypothetical protein